MMTIVVVSLFLSGFAAQLSGQPLTPVSPTAAETGARAGTDGRVKSVSSAEYWQSAVCRDCHDTIFQEYSQSMHEQSFTDPVFQAQYFKELLPLTFGNMDILPEAEKCIACHAPDAFIRNQGLIISKQQIDPLKSGVICDFCHRITGYKDGSPGNGNYISTPGTQKLGPFIKETNWHHVYSDLQTKSEFCAICHNAVNHYGLEIKSTYTEWKASRYAKEGIQCQDCHMNVQGFLTAGKPTFESGQASHASMAYSPYRSKLYTHRFPGAHSQEQVVGALTMGIEVENSNVSPGDEMRIQVLVDNSRTGHKMPSGSADLRLLWLDIKAVIGDKIIPVSPVATGGENSYGISGGGPSDSDIILRDIPEGRRVYRAVYVDKEERQTLSSYSAVNIIFDNRLEAAEIRKESYHLTIPKDVSGKILLVAQLNYLPYPSAFSERFGLPGPQAVTIAAAEKKIMIHSEKGFEGSRGQGVE